MKGEYMELEDILSKYKEILTMDEYWVAIWNENNIWNGMEFYLSFMKELDDMDAGYLHEIYHIDSKAIVINKCYWSDRIITEKEIKSMYEKKWSAYQIPKFLQCYEKKKYETKDRIIIGCEGLPFSSRYYSESTDRNPYIFDGSMEIKSYEQMHEILREKENKKKRKLKK